jgi:hypothetical protein
MIWVGSFKSLQSALREPFPRGTAGGAHLAAQRNRPDLTASGLAHKLDYGVSLCSRRGAVR